MKSTLRPACIAAFVLALFFTLGSFLPPFTSHGETISTVPPRDTADIPPAATSRANDTAPAPLTAADPQRAAQARTAYGKLPLSFEANRGQAGARARFLSRGAGYALALTADARAVLNLKSQTSNASLTIKPIGANPRPRVTGANQLSGKINYLLGSDASKWQRDVPTFSRVQYSEVYPGVDVVYYGNQGQLEYDFRIAPRADYQQIRLAFAGADEVRLDAGGDLIVRVGKDEVRQQKPLTYQEVNGARREIASRYVMKENGEVGFEVADYDRTRPLVIDPVLIYSTYIGGTAFDIIRDIAVDAAGNAYITGIATRNYPVVEPSLGRPTGIPSTNPSFTAPFVTKLNAAGSALVYSTYFGSTGSEGHGIALDSAGNAYVTGFAAHRQNEPAADNFPVTANAVQRVLNNERGGTFVVKINNTGSQLLYSTVIETGSGFGDGGRGIAVDGAGNAYIIGNGNGNALPLANPYRSELSYPHDGSASAELFVAKINTNPATCTPDTTQNVNCRESLLYSTFFGSIGSGDRGYALTIDDDGGMYITGSTDPSSGGTFPITRPVYGGSGGIAPNNPFRVGGAFVAKIDPTKAGEAQIVFSVVLISGSTQSGIQPQTVGTGIAVDKEKNVYVKGYAQGPGLATTPGAFQPQRRGSYDAFVTKLNADASALVYSTYLGGTERDDAGEANPFFSGGIAVDRYGNAVVTGWTVSNDFPTTDDAPQRTYGGNGNNNCRQANGVPEICKDAYAAKLNATGTRLIYSTYLGGTGEDLGINVATDFARNTYVVGRTNSRDNTDTPANEGFPVTPGAYRTTPAGFTTTDGFSTGEGFVTKIEPECEPPAPRDVQARLVAPNRFMVSWTDIGDNESFFEIERRDGTGAFTNVGTATANATSFIAEGSCAALPTFRVRAVGCRASDFSNEAAVPASTSKPMFKTMSANIVAADKPYRYDAQAPDSGGENVRFTLTNAPEGMTIDPLTGVVQWTPSAALIGQTFPVQISASNGRCNGDAVQDFTLSVGEVPPPGGFRLGVGNIEFTADAVFRVTNPGASNSPMVSLSAGKGIRPTDTEDGTYKLGGNTRLNNYLRFEGDITLVINRAAATIDVSINQGALYLTGIPFIGEKTIFRGEMMSFTVDGNGEITKVLQQNVETPLQAAGVDIKITTAKLLVEDSGNLGIRINGELNFPVVLNITGLRGTFQALEITQRDGVRFTGQIVIPSFEIAGYGIRNTQLAFIANQGDPTKDVFKGTGELVTPAFQVIGNVEFLGGALNAIGANLNTAGGIPIPPFLNLTGGGLEVGGFRDGNFTIFLNVNVTVVHPSLANIIALKKAGIRYTAPSSFSGSGDLSILTANVAETFLKLDFPREFAIGGQVALLPNFKIFIVKADLAAGARKNERGELIYFVEGSARGTLQLEKLPDGFPGNLVNRALPLPLATIEVVYRDGRFTTTHQIGILSLTLAVARQAGGGVQVFIGENLNRLIKVFGVTAPDGKRIVALSRADNQSMLAALGRDRASLNDNPLEGGGMYVPLLGVQPAAEIGAVTVAPATPQAVFRLFSPAGAPSYSLIRPDGTRLTQAQANNTNIFFVQNVEQKETYFVVNNPMAGDWKFDTAEGATGPFVIDAWGADAVPAISNVGASVSGTNVNITYNAADADDNPTVALYYDTDQSGFNGQLIAEGLPESATGTHTWNIGDGSVPSGEYFVYAVMDDGVNTPARRYAPTKITVRDPLAPATPQNVSVVSGGENDLVVSWAANTEADLRGYAVRYGVDTGTNTVLTETFDAGRQTSVRLPNLRNNTLYRVAVVAYDQTTTPNPADPNRPVIESRMSLPSATRTATTGTGVPPIVRITSPNGGETLRASDPVTISWRIENGADVRDQQVELSTDGGRTFRPLRLRLDGATRNFVWDVPAALRSTRTLIRVSALDRAGNEGTDTSDKTFAVNTTTKRRTFNRFAR